MYIARRPADRVLASWPAGGETAGQVARCLFFEFNSILKSKV